ncbi:MAG: hypothetical protein K2X77_18795 [Candidatus Obscuribacterales bacterium]|nr:hypothetical protein [Candidatus Obscuribacterales bacterium]
MNKAIKLKSPRGRRDQRNMSGSAAAVIASVFLLGILAVGAIATDVTHNVSVRTELQTATDAAALAGARALTDPDTQGAASYYATQTAAQNKADGSLVATDGNGSTVDVDVEMGGENTIGIVTVTANKPISNWLGSLIGHPTDTITTVSRAEASQTTFQVNSNVLFPLAVSIDAVPFDGNGNGPSSPSNDSNTTGGTTTTTTGTTTTADSGNNGNGKGNNGGGSSSSGTTSTADSGSNGNGKGNGKSPSTSTTTTTSGTTTSGTTTNTGSTSTTSTSASTTTTPSGTTVSTKALKDTNVGDKFYIYINSQQVKNGAFTSFTKPNPNANWLNDVIDQQLGLAAPVPNMVPSVKIGDPISLINGVAGQKSLAEGDRLQALQDKPIIYLPVMSGTPPFNQERPIIGWIAVKVDNVVTNQSGGVVETVEVTLLKAPILGRKGDIPPTGDASWDTALQNFSPSTVRLLSNM